MLRLRRGLIAVVGELLGFAIWAVALFLISVKTHSLIPLGFVIFAFVPSLLAMVGTIVAAMRGVSTTFKRHVMIGAALPILAWVAMMFVLFLRRPQSGTVAELYAIGVLLAFVVYGIEQRLSSSDAPDESL